MENFDHTLESSEIFQIVLWPKRLRLSALIVLQGVVALIGEITTETPRATEKKSKR